MQKQPGWNMIMDASNARRTPYNRNYAVSQSAAMGKCSLRMTLSPGAIGVLRRLGPTGQSMPPTGIYGPGSGIAVEIYRYCPTIIDFGGQYQSQDATIAGGGLS